MVKVFLRDILYIESMKDYVKVVTTENTIITKQSISSVEGMLPEKQFVRTPISSFIVSLQKGIRSSPRSSSSWGGSRYPSVNYTDQGVLKMLGRRIWPVLLDSMAGIAHEAAFFPVTVLVFLATPAGTGIVTADLWAYFAQWVPASPGSD